MPQPKQPISDQLLDVFMAACILGVPLGALVGGMVSVEMAFVLPVACVTWFLLAMIAKRA